MGLLGGTRIYVASAVTNLAGPEESRQNFLKSVVAGSMIAGDKGSLTDILQKSYMNGPGVSFKKLFSWCQNPTNFGNIGMPSITFGGYETVGKGPIAKWLDEFHGVPTNINDLIIEKVDSGPALYSWWAEQFVWAKRGNDIDKAWTADIDSVTGQITASYPGHWTETFTPQDIHSWNQAPVNTIPMYSSVFDKNARYLYVVYRYKGGVAGAVNVGIYKFGSGRVDLDAVIQQYDLLEDEVYPFFPVRVRNEFLSPTYNPIIFNETSKGFKRATGKKIGELVDKLAENEDLDDMDYAYVLMGVPLNTKDQAGLKYLYKFFDMLRQKQFGTGAHYDAFKAAQVEYDASVDAWIAWNSGGRSGPEPVIKNYPQSPTNEVRFHTNGGYGGDLDFQIQWKYIDEEAGTGLKKPDAKPGDIWFDLDPSDDYPTKIFSPTKTFTGKVTTIDVVRIHWQLSANRWKSLLLVGFRHLNYIYKNKYVEISMKEALEDVDDTGFLIPLHKPTLESLGMVDATQVATISLSLVINCYVVKKTSFVGALLAIVTFVVVVAVVVITQGAAAPGLLGTAGSVGAALGLTGLTAVIVGTVVNMIAAMILVKIIQAGAVALLGDKIGAIVGAVVGFVAVTMGTGLMNGQSLSTAFHSMMSASNLIQLTNAVGNGVAGYIQAAVGDIQQDMMKFAETNAGEIRKVQEAYAQNIGYDMGRIDPMSLTDASIRNFMESSSQFLSRTLLTGSDIAQMSMNMLTNFSELTLNTDLPLNAGA